MGTMASQIISLTIVYSTAYSRRRSKKTSKPRVTGLCAGNSPVTGEFPTQMASNAENVSIWRRHHDKMRVAFTIVSCVSIYLRNNHAGLYIRHNKQYSALMLMPTLQVISLRVTSTDIIWTIMAKTMWKDVFFTVAGKWEIHSKVVQDLSEMHLVICRENVVYISAQVFRSEKITPYIAVRC